MLCPYCLENISKKSACPQCKTAMPAKYMQMYSKLRPPVFLSAVGFRAHGKTVFLASLLHTLDTRLTRAWKGFYRQGLDQNTINTIKDNLALLEKGTLPQATQRNFPRPSINLLAKMPKFNNKTLVAYDAAGEIFEEDASIQEYASYLAHARTVMFLVSLVDLEDPLPADLHRLLEIYTLGMSRMGARTQKQHLVVGYTKADLLLDEKFFGKQDKLVNYLMHNEQEEIKDMKNYLGKMEGISQDLAEFTRDRLGAVNFSNLAQNGFRSVSYCAASALGSPPEDGKLSEAMQPRRVVDPLFWVLLRS
jgi:hypothetical protein